MYFVLEYDVIDGFIERRAPHRAAHLDHARQATERGELRLAGALADDGRALLLFQGPDRSVAERFAQSDPYVRAGLVRAHRVHEWTVVIGADYRP
jgi:uncharacterized protein